MFFAGSSNQYPKKSLAEKVFTTIKKIRNWMLSLASKEEKNFKMDLIALHKKSNLNPKIGVVKAQVLQCTF